MKYVLVINHDECFAPKCLRRLAKHYGKPPEKVIIVGRYTATEGFASRLKYQLISVASLGLRFVLNFTLVTQFKRIVLKDIEHDFDRMLVELGFQYRFIEDVNSDEFLKELGDCESDVVINIASQLYKKKTLDRLSKRVFNVHPGDLAINRGRYPAFWTAFLDLQSCLTCHELTEKIDEGGIQNFKTYDDPIPKTPATLTTQYAENLDSFVAESLESIEKGVSPIFLSQKGVYREQPRIRDLLPVIKI